MEIETVFYVTIFIMLCSLGAILWMIFSSHISNRNLAIQRDKLHELEIKNLEMEKLKSIATAGFLLGRYPHLVLIPAFDAGCSAVA